MPFIPFTPLTSLPPLLSAKPDPKLKPKSLPSSGDKVTTNGDCRQQEFSTDARKTKAPGSLLRPPLKRRTEPFTSRLNESSTAMCQLKGEAINSSEPLLSDKSKLPKPLGVAPPRFESVNFRAFGFSITWAEPSQTVPDV